MNAQVHLQARSGIAWIRDDAPVIFCTMASFVGVNLLIYPKIQSHSPGPPTLDRVEEVRYTAVVNCKPR